MKHGIKKKKKKKNKVSNDANTDKGMLFSQQNKWVK